MKKVVVVFFSWYTFEKDEEILVLWVAEGLWLVIISQFFLPRHRGINIYTHTVIGHRLYRYSEALISSWKCDDKRFRQRLFLLFSITLSFCWVRPSHYPIFSCFFSFFFLHVQCHAHIHTEDNILHQWKGRPGEVTAITTPFNKCEDGSIVLRLKSRTSLIQHPVYGCMDVKKVEWPPSPRLTSTSITCLTAKPALLSILQTHTHMQNELSPEMYFPSVVH